MVDWKDFLPRGSKCMTRVVGGSSTVAMKRFHNAIHNPPAEQQKLGRCSHVFSPLRCCHCCAAPLPLPDLNTESLNSLLLIRSQVCLGRSCLLSRCSLSRRATGSSDRMSLLWATVAVTLMQGSQRRFLLLFLPTTRHRSSLSTWPLLCL